MPRSIRIKTDGNSSKSTNLRYGAEIEKIIAAVDKKKKGGGEKRSRGTVFYSPIAMNKCMVSEFGSRDWEEQRTAYWVTEDAKLIEKTMKLTPSEQKKKIEATGKRPIFLTTKPIL